MPDECELRFDIPLPQNSTPAQFEKNWRVALAAQRMTALAVPPAEALRARFRVCGTTQTPTLTSYLPARLAALPGAPHVECELPQGDEWDDWQGVRVWLSYRMDCLPGLLQARAKTKPTFYSLRGRR